MMTTMPSAVAVAVPAFTVIPVLPKPMTKSFTKIDSPTASVSMVLVFDFPMKISFPSNVIDQLTLERLATPMFVIVSDAYSIFYCYKQ